MPTRTNHNSPPDRPTGRPPPTRAPPKHTHTHTRCRHTHPPQDGHTTVTWHQLTHWEECASWAAPAFQASPYSTAGGGRVVSVDATQTYSLPLLFAPSIAIAVTTTLHVTPDGVITRHTDAWRSVRVGSLPAARVLLQSPRALAAAVGRGSSKLLRVVGVGGGGVARRWRHSHAD